MRRALGTGICLIALASGCGGGSDRSGDRPSSASGSQGPAAAADLQASDGRLGAAVVARPGETKVTGGAGKITGRSILPPSTKHALGAEENCADVEVQPTSANLPHVSDVIFCLMNAMRENEGLPRLEQQDQLAAASVGHSQDMVTQKFFAHDSLDGRDLVARLTQASYIPKAGDWVVGENLAWGAGTLATPKALVNAWMNSPPHRENLLAGDFQDVGMGVVFGTPSKDVDNGVTMTTDFGTRLGSSGSDATDATGDGTAVTPRSTAASKRRAAARRKAALRRCTKRHGTSKRRCVRAARRIR